MSFHANQLIRTRPKKNNNKLEIKQTGQLVRPFQKKGIQKSRSVDYQYEIHPHKNDSLVTGMSGFGNPV